MSTMTRREFVRRTAKHAAVASALCAGAVELGANPLGLPIGCQTWPVREMIAKDFPGTIKVLAAAGFQDRKSTRLNSSHGYISYAVFCLKKKNKNSSVVTLLTVHLRCATAARRVT